MQPNPNRKLLTTSDLRGRYGKTDRTFSRWEHDEKLGFPKPIIIRGQRYWDLEALEAWEQSRASNRGVAA